MKCLNKNPYFSQLDQQQLEAIKGIMQKKHYKKNEIIFFEGEPGEYIYIIESGKIKMVKMLASGEEHILNIFKPGDLIAEIVVFDSQDYPATAISMDESLVYLLARQDLEKILLEFPRITVEFLRVISNRLRMAQKNVRDLSLKNSTARTAGILNYLARKHGNKNSAEQIEIAISLTQTDLANMIGTSRETVSRILSQFEEDNLITTSRKKIIIHSPGGLEKYEK